jgi:hypothetical protein
MAGALKSLIENDSLRTNYRCCAPLHLARHARANVAQDYLKVLEAASGVGTKALHPMH